MKRKIALALVISALLVSQTAAQDTAQATTANAAPNAAQNDDDDIRVYVPDGQLKNLPVRVYVTKDLTWEMKPRLRLCRCETTVDRHNSIHDLVFPIEVAPHQRWIDTIQGQEVSFSGTLLLFNLSKLSMPRFKAMIRVVPAVRWEEKHDDKVDTVTAIAQQEVYLGNVKVAAVWTILIMLIPIVFVGWASNRRSLSVIGVCLFRNGRLSLSMVQVALWTIFIASMVAMFGLIRLEIPDIPDSLVILMGLSLTTSGISYVRDKADSNAEETQKKPYKKPSWRWDDLIADTPSSERGEVSIARAQMLVWTVIMLVVFVSKSLIDGRLWDVPAEMVILMGMSQAGYIAPKEHKAFKRRQAEEKDAEIEKAKVEIEKTKAEAEEIKTQLEIAKAKADEAEAEAERAKAEVDKARIEADKDES